jgi:molybdopterin molybdotransferase
MTIHPAIHAPGCGCDSQPMLKSVISIDAALDCIDQNAIPPAASETVPLGSGFGRILARPVRAASMAPPFDNAAMDGYAVRSADLAGNGPWRLRVVARIPAGLDPRAAVAGTTAARIFTGAPVPVGADAVVMQEEVRREGDAIVLCRKPAPGLNIRKAGSDMRAGDCVLEPGCRLGAREIAACAAAGAGLVDVRPRLRVGLIVTGDEVRPAGDTRGSADIWDINTPMLSALLCGPALQVVSVGQAADNRRGLAAQLAALAAETDLIITTGGISVGEEDHVKPALADLGAEILFAGVAIKPGKPVSFGRIGRAMWLGLPGNPLSAFVTWQIFGHALLRRMTGQQDPRHPRRHVVLAEPIRRKAGRCELRPASLSGFDAAGRETVRCADAIHSGRVGFLPLSDGLLFIPADADHLPAGALVEFQPFCDAQGA